LWILAKDKAGNMTITGSNLFLFDATYYNVIVDANGGKQANAHPSTYTISGSSQTVTLPELAKDSTNELGYTYTVTFSGNGGSDPAPASKTGTSNITIDWSLSGWIIT
jgi:hypothetical protein